MTERRAPEWQVWTALWIVYIVWGSTYLGIRVLVETVPPLLSTGARFICAGAVIWLVVLARGGREAARPTRREVAAGALVGAFLIPCATGLIAIAESRGAPSSYAALIFASIPLWVVLLRRLTGERPTRQAYAGVAAGYVGVALLLAGGERPAGVALGTAALLVVAAVSWSIGSVWSRHLPAPDDAALMSALTTTCGGVLALLAGTLRGEWSELQLSAISGRSIAAFAYLVLIGSAVGFSAFVWLVHHAPISRVTTYAYVNPIVALVLGRLAFDEPVPAVALVGAAIVIGSVAVVVRAEPG
jgi:drug/metabolite transporter (DMT)-like permease